MLNIAELFYSIQGEGVTAGVPSIFIRLQGCNLMSIGVKPGRKIPKIWTPTGMRKITDIKAGDVVLGVDEDNKLVETTVKIISEYEIDKHVELKLQDQSSIFTSAEHPFLTNRGWYPAAKLKDMEIMHFKYNDLISHIKSGSRNPMKNKDTVQKRLKHVDYKSIGKKISATRKKLFKQNKLKTVVDNLKESGKYEEFIQRSSNRMKIYNPMFDPSIVKKSTAAHNSKKYKGYASKTEYTFHNLCKKVGLPVRYIGNFDLPIPVEGKRSHIYPDFIIEGTNRVIEVMYSSGRYSNRGDVWKNARKKILNDAGYEVVFADFDNKQDVENLIQYELEALNGVRVVDVKHYNNANKLTCYDLTCFPYHTFIVDGLVTHNCGGSGGTLVREGKATWWCDSEVVWRTGKDYTSEELEAKFIEMGQLGNVLMGMTHLVWTGGEPTIPRHVNAIMEFIDYLDEKYPESSIFNEIETNGTIKVKEEFYGKYINQINCSPKLSNSGIHKSVRINLMALNQIKQHLNHWFKIVVSRESDIEEILNDYIDGAGIEGRNIILMPACDNSADLAECTKFTWEMAMKTGWRMCTRLHILCYNKLVGV